MKTKKRMIIISCILLIVVVLAIATSYALFTINVTKNTNFKLVIGTLELSISDTVTEDKFIMESTVPTKDEIALTQDGYNFTISNTGTIDSYYTVYLDDILLDNAGERLDNSYIKSNLFNHETNQSITRYLSDYAETNRVLNTGIIKAQESVSYTLRMWVDYNAGNDAQNKYFATQIRVVGTQTNAIAYTEAILNGADPVLTDNLVAIQIAEDGTVTKANIQEEWYNYQNKNWANAVVLKTNKTYANGEIIPEDNIESYFVWIPRYKYKIFNEGTDTGLTSISSSEQVIEVIFESKDVTPSTGSTVGSYLTHPAFTAFDTNGIWVGKFETGYEGATSTTEAQVNSNDASKIIIKPNVYSWRSITVGNAFDASYNYLRTDESHMMKNTEWGAVAYLQHSAYGSATSVRINNNSAYITGYAATEEPTLGYSATSIEGNRYESTALATDGTYTVNYLNSLSSVSSTTGNKSGVYDMSGGAWEYVMGYTEGATTVGGSSEITDIYSDFFTNNSWDKYYDKYTSTTITNYNYRILGDATGEMGPFGSQVDPDNNTRYKSSWYGDYSHFSTSSHPWFYRGGHWSHGTTAGVFAFYGFTGGIYTNLSFRVVLAPTK